MGPLGDVWGRPGGPGGVFLRFWVISGPNWSPFLAPFCDDFRTLGLQKKEKGGIVVDFEGSLIFIDFSLIFGIPNHRKSMVLDKGKPSRNIVNNEVLKRSALFYRI